MGPFAQICQLVFTEFLDRGRILEAATGQVVKEGLRLLRHGAKDRAHRDVHGTGIGAEATAHTTGDHVVEAGEVEEEGVGQQADGPLAFGPLEEELGIVLKGGGAEDAFAAVADGAVDHAVVAADAG